MGDPRRLRKKYNTPTNPFEKERILEEFKYLGKYGLRNKKEFWKHRYQLSRFRSLARNARALPPKIQEQRLNELRSSISRLGLIPESAGFDEILSLSIEDILERRLQTQVYKLGLAKTVIQARQLVVHGHIAVQGTIVDSPSYLIKKDDESQIEFAANSAYKNRAIQQETPEEDE